MTKEIKETLKEMASVAEYLWHKGWAERNAGNMSMVVTDRIRDTLNTSEGEFVQLKTAYPGLRDQYILLSGSGTRMRDLSRKAKKNTCLIYINTGGESYSLFRDKEGTAVPTSELPTHLSIHQELIRDGRKERALVHAHVDELIALTQIKEFTTEESINKLLWSMHPETMLFIPEGAGFVPYILAGTDEIANNTVEALKKHRVIIWEKHGCLAVGEDLFEAFDQIDLLAKSANIYFMCRNAGHDPEGMTEDQLTEIRKQISG